MTRINTVPPKALTDQHLLGEYNEIRRPINLAIKRHEKEGNRIHRGIPNQYQLRAGHVIFFYNKLQYIIDRFEAIKEEMRARGWSANGVIDAEIPDELKPFYKDILGKSQALYQDSVSQGYQPYTGPSLAEFTPEQQQAFTGIAGLQGQQAPVYQEAMGMTRDAAAPITTEQIEEYMNPYQQAVVDIEKREAQKQYQSQVVPQLAAKAAMTQPFGGSRQAILEGMAADTQQRLLGDIQAKGSAQAYQDAVNLVQNQRDRLGSGAGQLATLGSNQFKSQLGEIGALQTVGEEKQQLAQQALNEAYGQYVKEQEFPFQQLGRYQSVVTGAPIQQTQYVPPTPPGPSVGQQLLGGAATMLGTYGAFGGKMPQLFGSTPAKTGGGIGDLPVIKRQQNASVDDDDVIAMQDKIDQINNLVLGLDEDMAKLSL